MRKKQGPSITTSINIKKGDSALFLHEAGCQKKRALSPFLKKVYRETIRIPRGQTRTYKWVAERIGHPRAYRAVGNALNKNPYPGKIPCHRVVKSDGSLGGFSKGPRAKKRLLSKEGVVV